MSVYNLSPNSISDFSVFGNKIEKHPAFSPQNCNVYEELEKHGYDDIDFLLQLGPHELEIIKGRTNMKEGHFMRFKQALQYWRDNVVTVTVTSSGCDLNDDVLRHSTGHSALPPRAAPSSESTTGPSSVGPTSSMAGPEVSGSHGPITDESIPATVSATATAEVTAEASNPRRDPNVFPTRLRRVEDCETYVVEPLHTNGLLMLSGQ